MPESNEHKESSTEKFLEKLGKAEDLITVLAEGAKEFGPSSLAMGLHTADATLGFFIGPLSAAYDAANPKNDSLIRAVSVIQIPVSLAAKYETVHGFLFHSAIEAGAAAEAQAANITVGSFLASPTTMAAAIASFKVGYQFGQFLDEHFHWSDKTSDWAIGYRNADHIDPADYPVTTIYHYLEANLPMPQEIREKVEQGLQDHGATWPQFNEYPLYLQHELTERAMETLESMANAVGTAAREMESWILVDPHMSSVTDTHGREHADPGHRDVPTLRADAEPASAHNQSIHSGSHSQVSDDEPTAAGKPIGYIEVLTAAGFQRVPYYDTPQHAKAAGPDASSHGGAASAPASVTHPVHYGPPAPGPEADIHPSSASAGPAHMTPVSTHHDTPDGGASHASSSQVHQVNLGVGLADDRGTDSSTPSGPATHGYLGVGLADDHSKEVAVETDLHHAALGGGNGPVGDSYAAADVLHYSVNQEQVDTAHQFDYGSADDSADFHNS
jgi:hypothetical protein